MCIVDVGAAEEETARRGYSLSFIVSAHLCYIPPERPFLHLQVRLRVFLLALPEPKATSEPPCAPSLPLLPVRRNHRDDPLAKILTAQHEAWERVSETSNAEAEEDSDPLLVSSGSGTIVPGQWLI